MADTTKRVKMRRTLAGPTVAYHAGREYDLEPELADALCADGRAELVDAPEPKTTKRGKGDKPSAGPAGGAEKRG